MDTDYKPIDMKDEDIETSVARPAEIPVSPDLHCCHQKRGLFFFGVLVGVAGTIVLHTIGRACMHFHHHGHFNPRFFSHHHHHHHPVLPGMSKPEDKLYFDMVAGPPPKVMENHHYHGMKNHDKGTWHDHHDNKKWHNHHDKKIWSDHHDMNIHDKKMWHGHHESSSDSREDEFIDMKMNIASTPKLDPYDLDMVRTYESLDGFEDNVSLDVFTESLDETVETVPVDLDILEASGSLDDPMVKVTFPELEKVEMNRVEEVRRDESP